MSTWQGNVLRGNRASQPAAASVVVGAIYCVTDESNILERSTGAAWEAFSPTGTGSGDVTASGTLTSGQLLVGGGTTVVAVSNLTGDVTTSGGVATTAKTALKTRPITFVFDGAGSVLTVGAKARLYVPYACTITAATVLLDQSGDVVIDVWKDTRANYPPTDADSITAAAPPTVSGAVQSQDTTLAGWTTAVSAGDTMIANIDSVATATFASLTLTVTV
jgi:hypothetical protein